jgi:hypothetical protein
MIRTLKAGLLIVLLVASAGSAQDKPKVDWTPMIGTWTLEMDMQGNVFAMTLDLKLDEKGQIVGTLFDQMGMMPPAPVSNAEFDGKTFKADVTAQTPPDGFERLLKIEAALAEGKLSGALSVPDMGVSLPFAGAKK